MAHNRTTDEREHASILLQWIVILLSCTLFWSIVGKLTVTLIWG